MASQAALIAETIAGMKRTLTDKYDSSDSDVSVEHATNRGNKLKRKSQFVHEGQLYGRRIYKRKIEHAGHSRYILSRNPKRYDCYGDELDDEDEDSNADAISLADDPFKDLKIEDILKPLTSAAEVPNHPSISNVYTSPVLDQMVQRACDMVQREEKTLWQIKKLATAFRGDQDKITGLEICSITDPLCFEPESIPIQLHAIVQPQVKARVESTDGREKATSHDETPENTIKPSQQQLRSSEIGKNHDASANTITRLDRDFDTSLRDGDEPVISRTVMDPDIEPQIPDRNQETAIDDGMDRIVEQADVSDSAIREQNDGAKIPSHRMTTRAQAQTTTDKLVPSTPRSPSPAISETASIHPIFQIPHSAIPDIDRALPPLEAEDTRAVLFLWVQKQEEVVRGVVRMYEGLLKANRMRKSVFAWCKAEGHLGEMSDGEDWYDKEAWGLDEDLRKGQEEEEDEAVNPSKKTRGRRAQ